MEGFWKLWECAATTPLSTMKNRRDLFIDNGRVVVSDIAFFTVPTRHLDRYDDNDALAGRFLNEKSRVVLVYGYHKGTMVTVKAHLDKVAADELVATLCHVEEACPRGVGAAKTPKFIDQGVCGTRTLENNGMVVSKGLRGERLVLHCVVQTYMQGFTAEQFVDSSTDRLLASRDNIAVELAAIDLEHWTWKPQRGYRGVVPGATFPACASDENSTTSDWSIFTWQQLQESRFRDDPHFDPRNFVWTRVAYCLKNAGVCGNEMAIALTGRMAADLQPYYRPLVDPPVECDDQITAFIENMDRRARAEIDPASKRACTGIPRQCFDQSFIGIAKLLRGVRDFASACSYHRIYPFDGKLANWVVNLVET